MLDINKDIFKKKIFFYGPQKKEIHTALKVE